MSTSVLSATLQVTYRKEPVKVLDVLTGYMNVHSPQTGDQVHLRRRRASSSARLLGAQRKVETDGNEHSTERSELGEHVVDLVVGVGPGDERQDVSRLKISADRSRRVKGARARRQTHISIEI